MKKNTVLIFPSYLKLWLLGIFLYVAGIGGNLAIAGGQVVLESAALEKDAGVLVLRGWVATEKSSNFAVVFETTCEIIAIIHISSVKWISSGHCLKARMPIGAAAFLIPSLFLPWSSPLACCWAG